MQELWADIPDYMGLYQVSNLGRVKSLCVTTNYKGKLYTKKERILSLGNKNGYKCVTLRNAYGSRTFLVHRLVALAFVLNPDKVTFDCINHIDEDRSNNCAYNLEWCTRAYNDNYGSRNEKLRWAQLGKRLSEATKQKLRERRGERAPMYGKKHSQATKDLISSKLKEQFVQGKVPSMLGVHRYGKDAPRYGAKLSAETKQKISASLTGRTLSNETKQKLSENTLNRVWINNGQSCKRVKPDELSHYLALGWIKGRKFIK